MKKTQLLTLTFLICGLSLALELPAGAQLSPPAMSSVLRATPAKLFPPKNDAMLCTEFDLNGQPTGNYIDCHQFQVGSGNPGITTYPPAAFTMNGYIWPSAKPNLSLTLSSSFFSLIPNPPLAIQVAGSMVGQWNLVATNAKIQMYLPNSGANAVADDQENLLMYNPGACPFGGTCTAAIFYHLNINNEMHGFDIVLYGVRGDGNPANYVLGNPLPYQTSITSAILHELGHAFGLGHSTVPGAIMTPGGYGWQGAIGTDDQNGVISLYGNYINNGFYASALNVSIGGSVTLTLDYGTANANRNYLIMGSWNAAPYYTPPTFLPTDSRKVFIEKTNMLDPLLFSTYVPHFSGTLDANGQAFLTVEYPLTGAYNPSGKTLYLSGVVQEASAYSGVSETLRNSYVHFN